MLSIQRITTHTCIAAALMLGVISVNVPNAHATTPVSDIMRTTGAFTYLGNGSFSFASSKCHVWSTDDVDPTTGNPIPQHCTYSGTVTQNGSGGYNGQSTLQSADGTTRCSYTATPDPSNPNIYHGKGTCTEQDADNPGFTTLATMRGKSNVNYPDYTASLTVKDAG